MNIRNNIKKLESEAGIKRLAFPSPEERKGYRRSIKESAESAIDALDLAAVTMHRQMKSGEMDQAAADNFISAAKRKIKIFRKAYFARTPDRHHLSRLQEFHRSDLMADLETSNERFGRVLKHYAKAVGADFQSSKNE